MKIIIDRNTPDSRQSAVVEIDTKYCHYPYAIRESIEMALKLDGYDERTIDEVFCRERVEFEQEKGCVDCIDDTDYMSKEKYNQIIDEAYKNYCNKQPEYWKDENGEIWHRYSNQHFINKCKTDSEFSERWGLKIEERELSLEERDDLKLKLILEYLNKKGIITASFEDFKKDEDKIPNIDWRSEVMEIIGWINYGNELKRNTLEEIYDDIQNIPTKLITITYNNETIESYE